MSFSLDVEFGLSPGGRAPTARELESGTRADVGRLLENAGLRPHAEAFQLLSQAWRADLALNRQAPHLEPIGVDRECESLIRGLCVAASRHPVVSPKALSDLYLVGEARVARCLSRALRHLSATQRQRAGQLCDALADSRSLEYLREIDPDDPHDAAISTIRTVCRLGNAAHLPQIKEALTHSDEGVCLWAIGAVKRIRPGDAAELLELAATKGRPLVRVTALTAMGELGDLSLLPRLMAELDAQSSFRRIGAARGLTALAILRPDGDFTPAMEALQKKSQLGGVEYVRALEVIRRAIGIDAELPIPSEHGRFGTNTLPIPGEQGNSALFQSHCPETPPEDALDEDEDDSLARRLNRILPHPDTWEYD